MLYGLSADIIQRITNVFTQFKEIKKVTLYGSRAKGNYKSGSDIDLCLFGEGINLALQYKIEFALDDLDLAYKFDIIVYDNINNANLIDHINRIGINIYDRDMIK
ncbi:MAG: hypothetical protein K0R14_1816 [Burkholderiales bacterium]|jgi:predicted nucleotidyltransferase|nr:hypothetical protein [Burkholderiales bacterium]